MALVEIDERSTYRAAHFTGKPVAADNGNLAVWWEPRAEPPMEGGHPEYLKILDGMRAMHVKKSADYGTDANAFANYDEARELGVSPWIAAMTRAADKYGRVKAFIRNGRLENESIDDALMDMAAHSLAALVLLREERAQKEAVK